MKILLSITLALSFNCMAEEENPLAICEAYQGLAKAIMSNRQANVSLSEMMKVANGSKRQQTLVEMAYEQPAYSSDKNKKREVLSFGNKVYLVCFKEVKYKGVNKQ